MIITKGIYCGIKRIERHCHLTPPCLAFAWRTVEHINTHGIRLVKHSSLWNESFWHSSMYIYIITTCPSWRHFKGWLSLKIIKIKYVSVFQSHEILLKVSKHCLYMLGTVFTGTCKGKQSKHRSKYYMKESSSMEKMVSFHFAFDTSRMLHDISDMSNKSSLVLVYVTTSTIGKCMTYTKQPFFNKVAMVKYTYFTWPPLSGSYIAVRITSLCKSPNTRFIRAIILGVRYHPKQSNCVNMVVVSLVDNY